MSGKNVHGSSWYGEVLSDLGAACRRDGLMQSAELLDDVALVLEQEQMRLLAERKQKSSDRKFVLKVVSN